MTNVAPPLDNFSEQRISLPLARAQQRENKVKEGVYCQGYLNKWLKGVGSVALMVMSNTDTLKTRKAETYFKSQAP